MPARFVEVTNLADAALKSDPLSYLPRVNLTLNTSRLAAFAEGWANWTGRGTNGTAFAIGHIAAPEGAAKYMMLAATLLLVVQVVAVRVSARRSLAQFGHAHKA